MLLLHRLAGHRLAPGERNGSGRGSHMAAVAGWPFINDEPRRLPQNQSRCRGRYGGVIWPAAPVDQHLDGSWSFLLGDCL